MQLLAFTLWPTHTNHSTHSNQKHQKQINLLEPPPAMNVPAAATQRALLPVLCCPRHSWLWHTPEKPATPAELQFWPLWHEGGAALEFHWWYGTEPASPLLCLFLLECLVQSRCSRQTPITPGHSRKCVCDLAVTTHLPVVPNETSVRIHKDCSLRDTKWQHKLTIYL